MEGNNAPSSSDKNAVTETPPNLTEAVKSSNPDISTSIKPAPNQSISGEKSEPSAKVN